MEHQNFKENRCSLKEKISRENAITQQTTLKQHWSSTLINVVSTLIFGWKWKLSRFNVDKKTLFQRWNLVEIEIWADVCLSTLKQHSKNYVDSTSINQCCFNFYIWLKMKVEFVHQRCFKTLRKQHWNNFTNIYYTNH